MKKILHVISSLEHGGTENYLLNLLKGTKNYKNYVLVYTTENKLEKQLNDLNVQVYTMSKNSSNKNRMKKIYEVCKKEKIDIVYSYTYYNSIFVQIAAFAAGVKKRITHSHRTSVDRKISSLKIFICRFLTTIFSTDCLACSMDAWNSLFVKVKNPIVVDNAIDIDKYEYNKAKRNKLRRELNIPDDYKVIGTVGRLDENKNQKFIIDLFKEYYNKNSKSMLVIIGDGPLMDYLAASSADIKDNVLLLGNKTNVNDYYNVFDLFMLVSISEGLPYVLIEAQANGLTCIVSDAVDKNANLNDKMKFISLNADNEAWIEAITENIGLRNKNLQAIKNKYSLDTMYKVINNIYEKR